MNSQQLKDLAEKAGLSYMPSNSPDFDGLWSELVNRIQSEDPCTTEADIRYFEGVNHV